MSSELSITSKETFNTFDIGSINDNLLGTQTDLSDLTQTVSVLQGKINGIQGIDIDVVQADVDALKKSAFADSKVASFTNGDIDAEELFATYPRKITP